MTVLDNLKRLAEEARKDGGFVCLRPQEAFDLIAEFEQRERKVGRLIAAGTPLAKAARALAFEIEYPGNEPWVDDLRYKAQEWDDAAADLQADSPPPIARDPVQDAPRRFWT